MKVSVVIPAIDEEESVGRAVRSALECGEVIVVDAGSLDNTVEAAKGAGAMVVSSEKGRGAQMDCGAALATGDVVLFLHADSVLPQGWTKQALGALTEDGCVGGAFTFSIDAVGFKYRALELMVRVRNALFGLVYGDQAIFVRKDVFKRAGGFNGLPLMEDVELVKGLRRLGGFKVLGGKVATSGRRWKKDGVIKRSCKNWGILIRYLLGAAPCELYGIYYGNK